MPLHRWFVPMLLVCLTALASTRLAAQETGTITGQVTDAASGQALVGAQVVIEATGIGTLTNPEGRYVLPGVPAGTPTVSATLIGYGPVTETVQITADGTAVLDLTLARTAISLDEVVVTAIGEQRIVEMGNAVSTLNAPDLTETAPVSTLTDLFQGRAAGVQVFNSSGSPGMGSRIRIRGSNSVSLSNEPLVYVDGIRVESGANADYSMGLGGQEPSRFDDLNPEDIESIEIVRGPAAATLYGTQAANGVVRITTKRGQPGETRWNVWAETGLTEEPNDYPLNYAGLTADREVCMVQDMLAGDCTQDQVSSYQVLDDAELSPKALGYTRELGLSIGGGTEVVDYYISGEFSQDVAPWKLPDRDRQDLEERNIRIDDDVIRPQNLDRSSLRANVNARLSERASLALNTGFVHSTLNSTGNDNNSFGFLPSAYFGGAIPEDGWEGAWGFQRPAQLFGVENLQVVDRFTASATPQYQPVDWLSLRLTAGLDYTKQADISWSPRDLGVPGATNLGEKNSDVTDIYHYTVDGVASAEFTLSPTLTSRTSLGVQYIRDVAHHTEAFGQDLPPGAGSINVAALTEADELHAESKTAGAFVEQQFGWNNRVFVTAALRADDNSAFGRDFEAIYYPKAAVSWLISDEPFMPEITGLDEFRLRVAAGRSGLQPEASAALRTLDGYAITNPDDETVVGVRLDEIGNELLEPELSSELEAGFDAGFWDGRIGLELTYYTKRSEAALIELPLPPSLGTNPDRWINVGEVENFGWELGLNALLLDRESVAFDVSVNGSINKNKLLTLGEDAEPIGDLTRHVPGLPLGGWWEEPVKYEDANGDGIIEFTEERQELVVGDTAVYVGPGMPQRQLSIGLNLTLFRNLRFNTLFDHRGDYFAFNNTEKFRCDFDLCRPLNDPTASLEDQARAVASHYPSNPTFSGYIEPADFWKLREASVTYTVPTQWTQRFGASRTAITLSGRNLFTWTDYTGMDPEINSQGADDDFGISEFLTQPPVRYWTLRVSLGF